jgi:hypothetical protein
MQHLIDSPANNPFTIVDIEARGCEIVCFTSSTIDSSPFTLKKKQERFTLAPVRSNKHAPGRNTTASAFHAAREAVARH